MSPEEVYQDVPTGSLPISTALGFTLVTSVFSKPCPCKPYWFLSLGLEPQPGVANWCFRVSFLDLQSVAFLKTISLKSGHSHSLSFLMTVTAGADVVCSPVWPSTALHSFPWFTSDWLCLSHWLQRKPLLYPSSVTLRIIPGGSYLTSFNLFPPPNLPGT